MDRLRELLARWAELTPEERAECLNLMTADNVAALNDEELAAAREAVQAWAEEIIEAGDRSDDTLATLQALADAVELAERDGERRATDAQRREDEAAALIERIRGQQEGEGEGGEGEGTEEEPNRAQPEPEQAPTPPTTPTPRVEPEEAGAEPEPVAAAAQPPRPRVSRVAARRPAVVQPRVERETVAMVAAGGIPNAPIQAGTPLRDPEQFTRAFLSTHQATSGWAAGRTRIPVARLSAGERAGYPDERHLDANLDSNMEKLSRLRADIRQRARGAEPMTAAGGLCAPRPVRYDVAVMGTDARPARDGLASFGATRGGVRLMVPPLLPTVSGAVTEWTELNDQDPAAPATKPCLAVPCGTTREKVVDAWVTCLQLGNFLDRSFPEWVTAFESLTDTWLSRVAERKLLVEMGTAANGVTRVTVGEALGTAPSVLAGLEQAVAVWVSSRRIDPGTVFEWFAPDWLRRQIRTDIARELPAGTVDERFAVADAQMRRWFAERQVTPTWLLDGETAGQEMTVQAAGALNGWPATALTYLFPAGEWLFLDGGELNLGIVRDSTLNATNDLQIWAEVFEQVIHAGAESWRIEFTVCPSGTRSGTTAFDPCP